MTEKQETVRQPRDQEESQACPSVRRLKAEDIFRAWRLGRTEAREAETPWQKEPKGGAAAEKLPEAGQL